MTTITQTNNLTEKQPTSLNEGRQETLGNHKVHLISSGISTTAFGGGVIAASVLGGPLSLIISLAIATFLALAYFIKSVFSQPKAAIPHPQSIQQSQDAVQKQVEEVVILGSGAAGSSAAIFTAQANRHPLVIQDIDCKAQMALIHTIDNYPGMLEEVEGVDLLNRFRTQAKAFGARFQEGSVLEVDLLNRPFRIKLSDGQTIHAKTLIIAAGTVKQWLELPNEQALRGRGVISASFCKQTNFKDKKVIVIGGGHAALQEAHFLSAVAKKVILVNRGSTFNASKFHQDLVMNNKKIEIIYNTKVEDVLDVSRGLFTSVVLKNKQTNEISEIPADILLVAIGNTPNSKLFKDQLEVSPKGQIVIHGKNSSTNIPGVFAAGDVSDVSYGRVVIAAGSGAMAALDATRYLDESYKSQQSSA